jgi:hypothetical protein
MAYTTATQWTTQNTSLEVWFERDRKNISLESGDVTIAEWWDDDVDQMFEDGFFDSNAFIMGKLVKKELLHESVVKYANEHNLGSQLRLPEEPDTFDMEVADRLWPEIDEPMED